MKKPIERLYNGIIKENPTFVLMLGMCPTLAVTTSAINGLGMGLSTCAVLMMSNLIISLLRKIIPDKVRMYASLGLFIPLIVVNCIILGRAEAYASKNPPLPSLFDGLGMGLGFTLALTLIGSFREILGKGSIFGVNIMPSFYEPVSVMIMAPGAFFVLAGLSAIMNRIRQKKNKPAPEKFCSGCCADCMDETCSIGKKEDKQ